MQALHKHKCALSNTPDDVIGVLQKEPLLSLCGIVNHTHSGNKVHDLCSAGVVEVVPALVATVTVHPVQPQLAVGGGLVTHTLEVELQSADIAVLLLSRVFAGCYKFIHGTCNVRNHHGLHLTCTQRFIYLRGRNFPQPGRTSANQLVTAHAHTGCQTRLKNHVSGGGAD